MTKNFYAPLHLTVTWFVLGSPMKYRTADFSGRLLQFLCLVRQRIHVHVSLQEAFGDPSHNFYVKMGMA